MLAGTQLPEWRTGVPARPAGGAPEKAWMAKSPTVRNFLDALAAVLAGNAIYFLLMPHLPQGMRHSLFKEDWGLLVDFAICTIIFVGVKIARR
jgi:hypothetical protein